MEGKIEGGVVFFAGGDIIPEMDVSVTAEFELDVSVSAEF